MAIKLNRKEFEEKIRSGDSPMGSYVLAVDEDGKGYHIYWLENNRQWNPWSGTPFITGIPALDPDGSGQAIEDAQDMFEAIGKKNEAEALMEAEDIGWVEAAERISPNDWQANREWQLAVICDSFLWSINHESYLWGWNEENQEPIECPYKFEWA